MSDYTSTVLATGDGSCELELVPEFGGVTNRLRFKIKAGKWLDVIAGLASSQELKNNASFRGVPLFPFANRLDGGSYEYESSRYHFNKNEASRNNALHGFLQDIKPEVSVLEEHESEAFVSLRYSYDGNNKGYPFPVEALISYQISQEQGLTIKFEVTNKSNQTIPAGK